MMYSSDKKMKDKMNPKRMPKSYGGTSKPERQKVYSGSRSMYQEGGMPKAKPC